MSVSYTQMVDSFGHEVLAFETTGSYQGDHWALLKSEDSRLGFMNFGYGSCSGCDNLQGEFDFRDEYWEDTDDTQWYHTVLSPLGLEKWDEFCKGYEDSIRWFNTGEELVTWLVDKDGLELQWFGSDDEFRQDVLPKFLQLATEHG